MTTPSVHPITQDPSPRLTPELAERLRRVVPTVAQAAVAAIIDEVPSYAHALSGPMGDTINRAVQMALSGFITLAAKSDASAPAPAAIEAAYQLGRGEARSGRTMEALLAAYRIGARVSWRDMAREVVAADIGAAPLSRFAELVFAYIDALSAASVSGHSDELEQSGRLRHRDLGRLARLLLAGADPEKVAAAAERAAWVPPGALTAVLLPESQVASALSVVDPATLHPTEDVAGLPPGTALLLVPTTGSRSSRKALLGHLRDIEAIVGPALDWLAAPDSYRRALRCHALDMPGLVDSDEHLAELLLAADPDVRTALRARVLEPLSGLRPSAAEKLTETLRAWLLHHGRRDAVAAALFVHPQTVRYRVGQLRDAYGERLDHPDFVRDATLALA